MASEYGDDGQPKASFSNAGPPDLTPLSQRRDDVTTTVHFDNETGTRQVTSPDGSTLAEFTFSAFGSLLASTGNADLPWMFRGFDGWLEHDSIPTLSYLFRNYSAALGRFLSPVNSKYWMSPVPMQSSMLADSGRIGVNHHQLMRIRGCFKNNTANTIRPNSIEGTDIECAKRMLNLLANESIGGWKATGGLLVNIVPMTWWMNAGLAVASVLEAVLGNNNINWRKMSQQELARTIYNELQKLKGSIGADDWDDADLKRIADEMAKKLLTATLKYCTTVRQGANTWGEKGWLFGGNRKNRGGEAVSCTMLVCVDATANKDFSWEIPWGLCTYACFKKGGQRCCCGDHRMIYISGIKGKITKGDCKSFIFPHGFVGEPIE